MFEFLFKYPLTAYRKGEFLFASGWPTWLLALLVALASGALLWRAHRARRRIGDGALRAVWALQALSASLVLFLVWQPALAIQSLKNRQNAVAVLLDTSRSMSFGADGTTRLEQATSALAERVLPGLEGKFRPCSTVSARPRNAWNRSTWKACRRQRLAAASANRC